MDNILFNINTVFHLECRGILILIAIWGTNSVMRSLFLLTDTSSHKILNLILVDVFDILSILHFAHSFNAFYFLYLPNYLLLLCYCIVLLIVCEDKG